MTAEDLRKSILQQAIQGKLVPQDPTDEPASKLLERIREEKARLVKEKKIKKDKNESIIFRGDDNSHYEKFADGTIKCIDDEIPFEIPESWEWVRFKTVADIARGGSPRPIKSYLTEDKNGINWIKIGDTEKGSKYINVVKEKIKPEGISKSRKVHKGDFLLTNSMSFGRPYITNVDGCIHDGWLVISPLANAYNQDFLFYLLSSAFAYNQFSGKVSGAVVKNLNTDKVLDAIMPLPPINEQKLIAQKIEDVQPLINKYKIAQEQSQEMDNVLNEQLKKSILQYAIQGKLVSQDPSDEPASELLKRIEAEKEKLIKAGKIKRDKNSSVIFKGDDNKYYEKVGSEVTCIDDELPFEIPTNWYWTRMGNIGVWGAGSTPQRSNPEYYNNGTIPWLKTGELNDGIVYDTSEKITEKAYKECSLRLNKIGDILIAMYGATIGKIAIVGKELTTNQACCGCTPFEGIYNLYLFYYLMANKQTFIKQGEGGAQPNISRDKLIKFLIPIPPTQEQQRIVERLDNILKGIEGI